MYCYPTHFFGLTKTHLETKQTKKINSCFVLVFYWGEKNILLSVSFESKVYRNDRLFLSLAVGNHV